MGSPPPLGSKKVVFKFRSVRSIVIAPANTGKDKSKSTAVIKTDQGNIGICPTKSPKHRKFVIVLIKFTAPNKEDTPAKWREKIAKSTEAPE